MCAGPRQPRAVAGLGPDGAAAGGPERGAGAVPTRPRVQVRERHRLGAHRALSRVRAPQAGVHRALQRVRVASWTACATVVVAAVLHGSHTQGLAWPDWWPTLFRPPPHRSCAARGRGTPTCRGACGRRRRATWSGRGSCSGRGRPSTRATPPCCRRAEQEGGVRCVGGAQQWLLLPVEP